MEHNKKENHSHNKEHSNKKKWLISIIILLILSCLVSSYYLIDKVKVFHVSKVLILGTKRCNRKEIEQIVSPAYGRCIMKVRLLDLYNKIKTIGWIKDLSIRRIWPNTLEISIKEREPLAILQADQLYLVDKEGVPIISVENLKAWPLPLITGLALEVVTISEPLDLPLLRSALEVLGSVQNMKADLLSGVSKVSLKNGEDIILYNKNGLNEIRLGHNNVKEKLLYFQSIWNDIKARVSGIEYIDLRYKNQVIVKPKKQIS